ncbi:hypothetical protein AADZ91_04955 [Colwelliaceae bacterium 6441]
MQSVGCFFKKNIDFIIDFPTQFIAKVIQNKQQNNIGSIEIEGVKEFFVSHIACNKSCIGEAFIESVNAILKTQYQSEAFYQAHSRYLMKDELPNFKSKFHAVFNH